MKNNFLQITCLLLISLVFFSPSSSDEFNFDVTQLQISEKGNIINGYGGGIVTTENNNIVITADSFEYNKLTTLLKATGNVKLIDKNQDIVIESNEFFYLKNKEKIYTKGESKAFRGLNIEIYADQYFEYNKLTLILEAKGNVVILDKIKDVTIKTNEAFYFKKKEKFFTKGKTEVFIKKNYYIDSSDLIFLHNLNILSSNKDTFFKDNTLNNAYQFKEFEYTINKKILKAKTINLTTNYQKPKSDKFFFKSGMFDFVNKKFLAKDVDILFYKDLFGDEDNDPRISSVSASGDELNSNFKKGVFTSCKKNDKCPPWKITAEEIRHDKVKKQIIYKDAWLEIYDFPVVYFPKFFHPDPGVKRQSGLLMPEIGDHNTLGDSIYLPYFFVVSEDKDITVKPRLFNNDIFVLQNEYRQKTKNSLTVVDTSITKGHNSNQYDRKDSRSHFFANTKIDLDLKKFINSNLEINYEKVSNDNYLKLFDFIKSPLLFEKNNEVLESIIKLDLEHKKFDLTSSFEMYETLTGVNSDRYQYVLPSFNLSKNFSVEPLNGSFNFNSYGNNTLSQTNITASTLFNDISYSSENLFTYNGIKTNHELFLKNVNSMGKNNIKYKNSPQSEIMSAFKYNVSLPLKKNNENNINTLTPKLSFQLSPHDMKNNEASLRKINADNIFSSNRMALQDSFEAGESLTLGVDFIKEKINVENKITEIEEYFDFKLATVLRFNEEKNIPKTSTLNKKKSNIFGQANFVPNKIFSLNYDFSLTDDLNAFEYNSLNAKLDFKNFSTQFNYLEERGVIGKTNVIENNSQYNFNEYNSIIFNTRRNRILNLTEYYDLVYEYKNDCLIAGIQYKKKYYNDEDLKPSEELFFSITIIPLTTFSPDKMILNKERLD